MYLFVLIIVWEIVCRRLCIHFIFDIKNYFFTNEFCQLVILLSICFIYCVNIYTIWIPYLVEYKCVLINAFFLVVPLSF